MEKAKEYVNLGIVHFNIVRYLEKINLNLSHLFVLLSVEEGSNSEIPQALLATLERKNFLLEGNLTNEGYKVLENYRNPDKIDVDNAKKELKKAKTEYNILFQEWWDKYPPGNAWKDDNSRGGKVWKGVRGFRTKKDDCEKLYLKALAEGTKHQDMLDAVEYEMEERKAESRKTGENKMSYMINTHTYLLNKLYLNFIEMMHIEGWKPSNNKDKGTKPENSSFNTMLI